MSGIEDAPFATGGFGSVHKARYQGDEVALKKIPLTSMTQKKREKLIRDFTSELTIMTKLVSSRRRADLHKPPQTFKR